MSSLPSFLGWLLVLASLIVELRDWCGVENEVWLVDDLDENDGDLPDGSEEILFVVMLVAIVAIVELLFCCVHVGYCHDDEGVLVNLAKGS